MRPLSRVPGSPLLSLCCLCDSHGCPPAAFPWVSPWNLALDPSLLQLPAPWPPLLCPLCLVCRQPPARCPLPAPSPSCLHAPSYGLCPFPSLPGLSRLSVVYLLQAAFLCSCPPFQNCRQTWSCLLLSLLPLSPCVTCLVLSLCPSDPLYHRCFVSNRWMTEANGREGTFPRSHSWVSDNHGTFRKSCIRNVLMGE